MRRFLKILYLVLCIGSNALAEEPVTINPYWLNIGLGGSPNHFNLNSSYNKSLDNLSYQISINYSKEYFLRIDAMTTGNLGLGISDHRSWYISSIYLGPSLSYGEARNNLDRYVDFWGAGIALNAQMYFMPLNNLFPGIGLGLEFFYNFNVMQTEDVNYRHVYSFRLSVCLTNLHDKL